MGDKTFWICAATVWLWFLLVVIALPVSAQEKTSTQLWGSVILGHHPNERFFMVAEIEPRTQISGEESWQALYATMALEYHLSKWFDLTGELSTGFTDQTNDLSSFEVTPRVGLRLHAVEQTIKQTPILQKTFIDRLPLKRFHLAAWLRLEYRNLFYSGDRESSREWRLRIRPAFRIAINNPSLGNDRTLFLHTDVEYFEPIGDDIPERFVNKFRFRIGPGYRINTRRKVELLFMYDLNRDSELVDFEEDAFAVDLRLTFLF